MGRSVGKLLGLEMKLERCMADGCGLHMGAMICSDLLHNTLDIELNLFPAG